MNAFQNAFWLSLGKLWPLYSLVLLGYLAGRFLKIPREPIATILIYIISPAVIFSGVIRAELGHGHLLLPVIIFCICTFLCTIFLQIGKHTVQGTTKNILAFGAGNCNSGYFAIPVGMSLFGTQSLPLFVLTNFGFLFYEYTVGFYVTARGHHSVQESLQRVFKLPVIYAFVVALVLNISGVRLSPPLEEMATHFRGAYSVLGMMLIGLGVAAIHKISLDWRYLSLTLIAKFLAWPSMVFLVITIDSNWSHLLSPDLYPKLQYLSIVPMAANTVALATELRTEPEKAALAVLTSTILALISVPLLAAILGL